MRVGRFYTHKYMTDVMFRHRGIHRHWESGEIFIVEWWSRRGWKLTDKLDVIYITSEQMENWYEYVA